MSKNILAARCRGTLRPLPPPLWTRGRLRPCLRSLRIHYAQEICGGISDCRNVLCVPREAMASFKASSVYARLRTRLEQVRS